MKRIKVENSTNLDEIGYDYDLKTLEIKFYNGGIYQYWPVSQMKWERFLNTKSKGTYFFKYIRHDKNINYRKIDDEIQAAN